LLVLEDFLITQGHDNRVSAIFHAYSRPDLCHTASNYSPNAKPESYGFNALFVKHFARAKNFKIFAIFLKKLLHMKDF